MIFDSGMPMEHRTHCCVALRQAVPNGEIGETMLLFLEDAPLGSELAGAAVTTYRGHASDPVKGLLQLLESGDDVVRQQAGEEISTIVQTGLDQQLLALAKRSGTATQRVVAEVILRRLSSASELEIVKWILDYLGGVRDDAQLVFATERISTAGFPRRNQGVSYDAFLANAFSSASTVERMVAGLGAVAALGEATGYEVSEALLSAWEDISALPRRERAEFDDFLQRIPGVLKLVTGETLRTPKEFENWLQSQ
jgi:hypothetical protein